MTQPWNMARVRSHQLPRRYKPVGPVDCCGTQDVNSSSVTLSSGERVPYKQYLRLRTQDIVCPGCGYHICGCGLVAPPYGVTDEGVPIEHHSYVKPRSDLAWYCPVAHRLYCGLLTREKLEALRRWKLPRATELAKMREVQLQHEAARALLLTGDLAGFADLIKQPAETQGTEP